MSGGGQAVVDHIQLLNKLVTADDPRGFYQAFAEVFINNHVEQIRFRNLPSFKIKGAGPIISFLFEGVSSQAAGLAAADIADEYIANGGVNDFGPRDDDKAYTAVTNYLKPLYLTHRARYDAVNAGLNNLARDGRLTIHERDILTALNDSYLRAGIADANETARIILRDDPLLLNRYSEDPGLWGQDIQATLSSSEYDGNSAAFFGVELSDAGLTRRGIAERYEGRADRVVAVRNPDGTFTVMLRTDGNTHYYTTVIELDESGRELNEKRYESPNLNPIHCFAAGTSIEMSDGSQKSIEQIKLGDEIFAYDASDRKGRGNLSPRRVTRTYATPDKLVIDFHGLKVTPGHVFLCGDGQFAGEHRMLMEILRSDGTIVSANGSVLRAATNAPVGSREDAFLQVAYLTDANDALMQSGRMRAGTLIFTAEGETKSVLECLEAEGYRFDAETGLVAKDGEEPHPLYWYGEIPRPEDYVLKRSDLTDADLYAEPGYRPEVATSQASSRLGQGHTPSEGLLYAEAGKQAGETIH